MYLLISISENANQCAKRRLILFLPVEVKETLSISGN